MPNFSLSLPSISTVQEAWSHPLSALDKFDLWCRKEPKATLIAAGALAAIGILPLAVAPVVGASILGLAGGIASYVTWNHRYVIRHIAHDTLKLPYTPQLNHPSFTSQPLIVSSEGKRLASLTYRSVSSNQSIPVLHLEDNLSPKEQGEAQGYALAEPLWNLIFQVMPLMMAEAGKDRHDPTLAQLQRQGEELSFSQDILDEFEGIADGFIRWAKTKNFNETHENFIDKKTILTFLRQAHVLTDTYKAIGSGHGLPGCSTAVMHDSQGNLVVGRLLDWISLGTIGLLLFIKSYTVTSSSGQPQHVYSHTFPGFIGGLTCWNENGLKIIVNELGVTSLPSGTPYNLVVRELIEQCLSVEEVKAKLVDRQHNLTSRIASSVSLTVVDNQTASLFQLYPNGESATESGTILAPASSSVAALTCLAPGLFERPYRQGDAPLLVTNHAYAILPDNNYHTIPQSLCDGTSEQRLCHMLATPPGSIEALLKAAGEIATIGAYVLTNSDQIKITNDNYNAFEMLPQAHFFSTKSLR